jgi:hypothetical protein
MKRINLLKLQGLKPGYIVGLIDGEGSFNITISKDLNRSSNYRLIDEVDARYSKCSFNPTFTEFKRLF